MIDNELYKKLYYDKGYLDAKEYYEKLLKIACEKLEKEVSVPIVLWDERLTTVESHNMMKEAGMDWRKRNKVVDKVSSIFKSIKK